MLVDECKRAIGRAPWSALDEIAKQMWGGLAAGYLTEAEAEGLDELIRAKRRARLSAPQKVHTGSRPRTSESLARRRSLAAGGVLPPALASAFTTAELAALAILAIEHRKQGACDRSVAELAARAGVSESSVRNAWRQAKALGLIEVEQRRVRYDRNLPNLVRIVSPEWLAWLKRGPRPSQGGGCKSVQATDTNRYKQTPFRQFEPGLARRKRASRASFASGFG